MRRDRMGIRAARFAEHFFRDRGHDITLIDAQEYNFGLLDRMYKEYEPGTAPARMEQLAEMIRTADGFLVVSGEYNHSIQPGLTNLMDHFLEEYFFRPSAIICYSDGRFGGMRAAMQLRALLTEIGTVCIPSIFPIATVQKAFDENGRPLDEKLSRYIVRFAEEFEWYAEAIRDGRRTRPVPY